MPKPKMKASGHSPARSEPQTPAGSQNLLRTALTRSAAARRPKGINDSKRSTTSALSDLSNLSGLNSSLNNTQAKKIAALAAFKAFENEITPRQAIREFNQANLSTAVTPSLFMPRKSTRKRKADAVAEPAAELVNSAVPHIVVEEEEEEEEDVSSEASSSESAVVTRRKSARLSRTRGITLEDLDSDKDLTKPTNVSASVRPSEDTLLLDDSNDTTMMAVLKRRRDKPKKKHFTLSDFDISQMPKPAEKAEVENTLSQSVASDDSRDASQLVIDEKMKKRREMLEKKMLRKKKMLKSKPPVQQWDFSGIEPPAPIMAPEKETAQAAAEVLSPPEELPVVSPSVQGGGKERRPMDFSNLLEIGNDDDDDDEENVVAEELEAESVEDEGRRRKSVYKAGNTSQKSLMLDQSEFRPETESTRIASVSSCDFQTKSPVGVKPGRDTSTPFVTRRQQALSKSAVVSREQVAESRANHTLDPRLPTSSLTPGTASLVSGARRSGLTLPEEIVEGATQTSPHLETDVGCQVTPSLAEPSTATLTSQHPANISHVSAAEKSAGLGQRHQLNDLTNSLAEEINIDLPPEEEDEETEELQQNITNSGRKNPSPISERRNEVEEADGFDEDEEDDEVFVEPCQGSSRAANQEDLLSNVDVEEAKDQEEEEEVENIENGEDADYMEDGEEVSGGSRDVLNLPETSSSKVQPSSGEVRDLRQARLTRYLGIQDSASPLISPLNSPEKEKVLEKPKPRAKPRKKEDPKLIFPAKQVKFEYQRFSRYKLKAESESTLVKASQDFLKEALQRMSRWAGERGVNNIHLCDIKRMMEQCGFVPNQEQDPHLRVFHETIRDIGRQEHVEELIPCNLGRGEIYPPKDCWEVTGEKKKRKRKPKADQVKRLKGRNLENTDGEN